jgi:hypothetical protein
VFSPCSKAPESYDSVILEKKSMALISSRFMAFG